MKPPSVSARIWDATAALISSGLRDTVAVMNFEPRQLSRREAIGALGLLALTSCTLTSSAAAAKRKMALQLYTLRDPAKQDLAGTLKKVREMGWEWVQWSGMPNLSGEKIREALDTAGLRAMSAHVGIEPFEKDFDANLRTWKTVGVTHIGPGGMMNDCKATLKDWLNGARRLDALGAKLRAAGIRLSYHNHAWEFEKFPGDDRPKWNILLEATKPENLTAEIDLAWAYVAGADPANCIRTCKGRVPVVHAKDVVKAKGSQKQAFKPLGQGELSWPEIFSAGAASGVEWYVYEQDSGEGSPFDYTHASYEFLVKQMK